MCECEVTIFRNFGKEKGRSVWRRKAGTGAGVHARHRDNSNKTHRPRQAKRSRCRRRRAECDREAVEKDLRRRTMTTRQKIAANPSSPARTEQLATFVDALLPGHVRKTMRDCSSTTVKSETGPPKSPLRWSLCGTGMIVLCVELVGVWVNARFPLATRVMGAM